MESTLATGLILISPILLVRFLLLSYLGKEALKRAAFFPRLKELKELLI